MIYQTVVLASILAVANAGLFVNDVEMQKDMWNTFKQEYRKSYEPKEDAVRFENFLVNLRFADKRNELERAAGGSAIHGITKFSDLSNEEFASTYLSSRPVSSSDAATVDVTASVDANMGLVDWTGKYTTPVKNQWYCGSCWAFSATEQIESDSMRTLGTNYILSPEQITQCDRGSFGCGGGWTETAYTYVQRAGGLGLDSEYPYTSQNGTTGDCHSFRPVVTVTGFTKITGANTADIENNMAGYMQSTGPLSVCLDASSWNSYTGGVMSSCGTSVDHCVQAVGVDAGSYWKIRNSWGTSWGEGGYIRLSYGSNTCAITNDPTYVAVRNV